MSGQYWTHTWNPLPGCSPVSAGCAHCWAARMATRHAGNPATPQYHGLARGGHWTGETRLLPEVLAAPLRWRKPRIVLTNCMGDLFHLGNRNEQIAAVFGVIATCQESIFIVPTKRLARARAWFGWVQSEWEECRESLVYCRTSTQADICRGAAIAAGAPVKIKMTTEPWPLPNVWLLASVEDQATADERIPELLDCPAAVRGISLEPMIGPVDLTCVAPWDDFHIDALDTPDPSFKLGWVVCGSETGPGARPCDPDWLRAVRDACVAAGVPFWLKQIDAQRNRHLDGRTWEEVPR